MGLHTSDSVCSQGMVIHLIQADMSTLGGLGGLRFIIKAYRREQCVIEICEKQELGIRCRAVS